MESHKKEVSTMAGSSDNIEIILKLNGDIQNIKWNKNTVLLDALLNSGVAAPHSCCRGTCGTCVCRLEEGEVRLKRNFVLSETHIQQGLILPCVAVPVSECITINYDEF